MHLRIQMRHQCLFILSMLVLKRTNSLQGLALMRMTLLRLLHLLFRLLCELRLLSHLTMRILHLHVQQAGRVAGEQHHLLQNSQSVALLTVLQVNGGKPTTGELKALHL